jgi:hypothetical protein
LSSQTAVEKLRKNGQLDAESSALSHIICHPWHSRIWTVQEAVYSKDCLVVCGRSAIQWDVYSSATHFLVFEEFLEQLNVQAHKSNIAIDVRNVLRDYIHEIPLSKPNPNPQDEEDERDQRVVFLTSCLTDLIQLQATEPRDKIYGVHALFTELGILLPEVRYEKSIARVYEEAAVAMIIWSGTLKVLSDACRSHMDTSFPSWVTDWYNETIKVFTPPGNATGGSKIPKSSPEVLNPIPGELHVRGKIIGRVEAWRENRSLTAVFPTRAEQCKLSILTEKIPGLVDDVDFLRLWIDKTRFFRQLYAFLQTHPVYCQEAEVEDRLFDILNQDSYSDPHEIFRAWLDLLKYPETKYDLTMGEVLVDRWIPTKASAAVHWTEELKSCAVIMASLLANSIGYEGSTLKHTPDILELVNQFSMNLNDKTLIFVQLDFLSKTVLGTGFHSLIAGDAIVLLQGAEWPVVLRQIRSRWRLIGPAFVTGAMDGEAWTNESDDLDEMDAFILI